MIIVEDQAEPGEGAELRVEERGRGTAEAMKKKESQVLKKLYA